MKSQEIKIRELEERDLSNGFLESLDSLRKASDLTPKKAKEIFKKIKSDKNYMICVAVLDSQVVGAATIFIEQKFINKGGKVGHIEDVAVRKNYQGKGIGQKIIKALVLFAKKEGCYKTILDCQDDLIPFYEKAGFKRHSNAMRYDY
ncbi:MAG TPA: GNAT family N-acetyltransferase [Nitrosopumilaceae archaeon]|nr:GNAT family N-acetyltransferase [Nitrosopumilaceae archaeon]